MASQADYSRLTAALRSRAEDIVTLSWQELDDIVGGLPASAVKHHPQWWHGERSHTLAWRQAGYRLDSVDLGRSVTFRRTEKPAQRPVGPRPRAHRPVRPPGGLRQPEGGSMLSRIDPCAALVVIGCSADKARSGHTTSGDVGGAWPQELLDARDRVLETFGRDERTLLPAWQRYTGHFYQCAGGSLREAVANGRVVILSGGYGIVRGDERIGYYDRKLRLADWPPGLLERLLVEEARRAQATTVVGFVAKTSNYAKLLRRVDWRRAGIGVHLVSIQHQGGGALREVPQQLGRAFSAFWRQSAADYPRGTIVETWS